MARGIGAALHAVVVVTLIWAAWRGLDHSAAEGDAERLDYFWFDMPRRSTLLVGALAITIGLVVWLKKARRKVLLIADVLYLALGGQILSAAAFAAWVPAGVPFEAVYVLYFVMTAALLYPVLADKRRPLGALPQGAPPSGYPGAYPGYDPRWGRPANPGQVGSPYPGGPGAPVVATPLIDPNQLPAEDRL